MLIFSPILSFKKHIRFQLSVTEFFFSTVLCYRLINLLQERTLCKLSLIKQLHVMKPTELLRKLIIKWVVYFEVQNVKSSFCACYFSFPVHSSMVILSYLKVPFCNSFLKSLRKLSIITWFLIVSLIFSYSNCYFYSSSVQGLKYT